MSVEISNQKNSNYDNQERGYLGQPVVYGVIPDQLNDEISLVDLFSKLAAQWKVIAAVIVGGTLLAALVALLLRPVYQPSLEVSVPPAGNIAALTTVNTLMAGQSQIPSSPKAVFASYYNQLRSRDAFAEFISDSNHLAEHHPDVTALEEKSALLANLIKDLKVDIVEPVPERKGDFIANPLRVVFSVNVENEVAGVELLNNFVVNANQRLLDKLYNDVHITIKHKIDVLTKQVATLRVQHHQSRMLTIKKMEQDNAKKIALLQEQISAYVVKAKANRLTQIANAEEALNMAKSLGIIYPTTLDVLAQREQEGRSVNTAITVLDRQVSSLYLQGTKFLTALIKTLSNRKSDEGHLEEINDLREKIQLIKNDQTLIALKQRQSDDPWIKELPAKLAEKSALKALSPDFTDVVAFTMDSSAVVTNVKVKPNRKLIVAIGFVLSLFIALFVALIVASLKERNIAVENARD